MTPARRISIGLLALAGSFGGVDLAQRFGLGTGYALPAASRGEPAAPLALNREAFKLRGWGEYAVVLDRPIFNEDRKPTPVSDTASSDRPEEATAKPLNATLTSIILTPDVKLAIVKNNDTGESEVIRIGRPLAGEQNGWKLVEVSPRGATFEGQGLGRQALELAVSETGSGVQMMVPPASVDGSKPSQPANGQPKAVANPAQPETDAASQAHAEEIRRRIEERRRQLREEAERMRSEQTN
jgi:general secretion pathway protein N